MGVDARLVSFAFACLPVFCLFRFVFLLQENQVMIIFLRAEENLGREKKTNGDGNQVGEEQNRRASIFWPINPLKTNTSRSGSITMRWGQGISIPGFGYPFLL